MKKGSKLTGKLHINKQKHVAEQIFCIKVYYKVVTMKTLDNA